MIDLCSTKLLNLGMTFSNFFKIYFIYIPIGKVKLLMEKHKLKRNKQWI